MLHKLAVQSVHMLSAQYATQAGRPIDYTSWPPNLLYKPVAQAHDLININFIEKSFNILQ